MEPLKKEVVMKSIEIDDDLYAFIASQTKHIGESASHILRRLLLPEDGAVTNAAASVPTTQANKAVEAAPVSSVDNTEIRKDDTTDTATANNEGKVEKTKTATRQTAAKTSTVSAPKKAPAKKAPVKKATSTRSTSMSKKASAAKPVVEAVASIHDKRDILDAVSKDALSTFTKRVDQFLFVLSAAHKLNAASFSNVETIKGKNRTYFATSKDALLENGSSTNPKAIPNSPYWVVTNNNTAKKTNMLEQVLRNLGYQPDVIETVVARFSSEGK